MFKNEVVEAYFFKERYRKLYNYILDISSIDTFKIIRTCLWFKLDEVEVLNCSEIIENTHKFFSELVFEESQEGSLFTYITVPDDQSANELVEFHHNNISNYETLKICLYQISRKFPKLIKTGLFSCERYYLADDTVNLAKKSLEIIKKHI